jgi:hypothetical protein
MLPITIKDLGRSAIGDRLVIPLYINPQTFSIQEKKLITPTLTKGGYVIQYWGEELPVIQASGTTGSGGIEAINILRDIYRHEQIHFNQLLIERARLLEEEARNNLENIPTFTAGSTVTGILDSLTAGGFSDIVNGVESSIEAITDAALGITDDNPASVELVPTIGAFASSMILFFQGEKFHGFFQDFKVDENATKPGHFDYSFSFSVTKRTGRRGNFMPWHRSPFDATGFPTTVSLPKEGQKLEELSFATTQSSVVSTKPRSTFDETQESPQEDINGVNVNRNSTVAGPR